MPVCLSVGADWPVPWVSYDQSTATPCLARHYIPVGGWEIGARPPTITLSLNASIAFPTQEFSIYDKNGVKIGTSPLGVLAGLSTKIITIAYGTFDIGYLYAKYVGPSTSPLLITAVDGLAPPAFWQNFHGQYEVA